jgi:transcriptional regulator with XRE-family HTH domain
MNEYSYWSFRPAMAEVTVSAYGTVTQRNLTCAIRIKARRRQLGLTQAEVVDRIARHGPPLSSQALSAVENGRRLAVGHLPGLAAALDCTVTYLIGLTADPRRWEPDEPAGRTASADPSDPPHRNWILGPDVPDEIRRQSPETAPAHPIL